MGLYVQFIKKWHKRKNQTTQFQPKWFPPVQPTKEKILGFHIKRQDEKQVVGFMNTKNFKKQKIAQTGQENKREKRKEKNRKWIAQTKQGNKKGK